MKIIVITSGNLPSYIGLHSILKERTSEIKKIFITTKVPGQKGRSGNLINTIKKSGINYIVFKVLYNIFLPEFFGMIKLPCTVWKRAKLLGIPCINTNDVNSQENINEIRKIGPDVIISFSATQRFCDDIINAPNLMAINIHFSLLPKYGGLSPYVWQLIHGEKTTGVTVHQMVSKLDAGPILMQKEIKVIPRTSALRLLTEQAIAASQLLLDALKHIENKEYKLSPQKLSERTYFRHPQRSDLRKMYIRGFKLVALSDFFYIGKVLKKIDEAFR